MSKTKIILKSLFENSDLIVLIVFGVFVSCFLIDTTVIAKNYEIVVVMLKVARYSCYVFFAFKVAVDVLRERKISLVMVVSVVAVLCVLISAKNITFGFAVLMLCALRGIDVKKIAKWCFYIIGSLYFITIALSLVGVIPDWTYQRDDVLRHSLGFVYPTDAFAVYLSVVILGVVAFGANISFIAILVAEVVNYGIFWYTDGRLSFVLVTMLLIVLAVLKILIIKTPRFEDVVNNCLANKIVRMLLLGVPFFLFAFSVVLTLLYKNGNGIAISVNDFLSDRLLYSAKAVSSYPLMPFGTFVDWQGLGGMGYVEAIPEDFANAYNFVDISYIRCLFDFGIVPTIIIVTGYGLAIKKAADKKDIILVLCLLVTVLWCFVEPFIFTIGKNVMVVCLAQFMNCCNVTMKPLTWLGDKFEKFIA